MSENSKIEWTDHTFNPWEGCQKVGPGCDHCYAEARNARFAGGSAVNWGPGAPRRRTSASNWHKPVVWNAAHDKFFAEHGRRQRVFCASLADVFDNAVDPQWRADLFDLILATQNLDWLLLTKRIGNARKMLNDIAVCRGALLTANDEYRPPANVRLGATICDQTEYDRDIGKLLRIPAAGHFVSFEPMLGPIDMRMGGASTPDYAPLNPLPQLSWAICGGESGPGARPMHPDWGRSLRDQCQAAGVPFFYKHHGEWREPIEGEEYDTTMGEAQHRLAFIVALDGTVHCFHNAQTRNMGRVMLRVGKKAAGRLLDGREWNEVPA